MNYFCYFLCWTFSFFLCFTKYFHSFLCSQTSSIFVFDQTIFFLFCSNITHALYQRSNGPSLTVQLKVFTQPLWNTEVSLSSEWRLGINFTLKVYKRLFLALWVLQYLGIVGRFRGDDPRFGGFNPIGSLFYTSTQSDWPSLSAEKNRLVSITFSSKDTRTKSWSIFSPKCII